MSNLQSTADLIRDGGVIAYPTESCYGLGCDPNNEASVKRILALKQRSVEKGLILVADRASRFDLYVSWPDTAVLEQVNHSWPGPTTWLLPVASGTPPWLCGQYASLAVRVSAHPVIQALCDACGMALVSTSANIQGQPSAQSAGQVRRYFPEGIDSIVEGELGEHSRPSRIIDATSGKILRE